MSLCVSMAKPCRIFIIRHGESEGNVNKQIYNFKPDYSVNLTSNGVLQAISAGKKIGDITRQETVGAYVSPFYRTRQTWSYLKDFLNVTFEREDPRLREQEWSTCLRVESKFSEEKERDDYGMFYFRFETGESCADVYDRVSSFLDTLHRDFEKNDFPENVVIVGHGMTNRVFLMRWFHWTVEQFELLRNPKNCEYFTLLLQPSGKYVLSEEPKKYDQSWRKH
jgi:broad specificity phosphatase PhoE